MTQRARMRVLTVALVGVAALQLTSCGKTVDHESVERSITQFVSSQTGRTPLVVSCPKGVDAKVGEEFDCHYSLSPVIPDASRPGLESYTAHIKITAVDGNDIKFDITTCPTFTGFPTTTTPGYFVPIAAGCQ